MNAPFPWFGGKSRVAHVVWDRFGDVPNYVEPFAGSLAVLLGRPHAPGIETVNDLDCYLANFWRAIRYDPAATAEWTDWPVNEADLQARHQWLVNQESFREQVKADPEFYDCRIAGWWVWGLCSWIGVGWCDERKSTLGNAGRGVNRQLPHLGDAGRGVNRKLLHLGDAGQGVNRKRGDAGQGVNRKRGETIEDYFQTLSKRLRNVRVCCGDWARILSEAPTTEQGMTGVFLDPPYSVADRVEVYAKDDFNIAHDVRQWAREHGDNPLLRIALCGYSSEHDMPGWECVHWKTIGGYGRRGSQGSQGSRNAHRERIWFSPKCLKPPTLFSEADSA